MNNLEFRAFLILLMCSDPWPVPGDSDESGQSLVLAYADKEAEKRGFTSWVEAYHGSF